MRALALAIAVSGCASQNRNVVTMDVRPVEGSGGRTVELDRGVALKVLGRNGPIFSIVPDPRIGPGCARGLINNVNVGGGGDGAGTTTVTTISVKICPAGQEQGWSRWHADVQQIVGASQSRTLPPTFEFATKLPSEWMLAIGTGERHLEVSLPGGPFGEAVRRHPELLGAVMVIGLVPRSSNGRYEVVP